MFLKICSLIENHVSEITKEKILIDVDGSCFQRYHIPQGIIKVSNDFEVYALYVDSDIDLTNIWGVEL
jgi:hypothetical protein